MHRIKSYLQKFVQYGLHPKSDEGERKRIVLLNVFSALAVLTFGLSYLDSVFFNEPTVYQIINAVMIFAFGITPLFIRWSSYFAAAYLIFLANTAILFFTNSQGMETATYLFYFPQFFAVAWLMEFKRPWYNVILASFTFLSVLLLIVLPDHLFGPPLGGLTAHFSFLFNLITSVFLVAVNTIVIVWLNYSRHKLLEDKISEKEKVAQELAQTLKAKEVLVAEIHHRVKNNLAVIRSLLNLQINSTSNDIAKETLRESASRVSAMALIHQKLYANMNPENIDLKSYVTELVHDVGSTFRNSVNVAPAVSFSIQDVTVNLNKAIPCGLILNELLTNVYKHAFREHTDPRIAISISKNQTSTNKIQIIVEDNGCGIDPSVSDLSSETLGMTIINSLSEQLDGTFTITNGEKKGTRAILVFPDNLLG
jgi:two-component sensor histidine kinase